MDPLRELVLPLLDGVRKSGGVYSARCPAHEDTHASLSVSEGRDQPVVFHCHAGCHPEDIVAKLGLSWADISAPRGDDGAETIKGEPITARYDYRALDGALAYQVVRYGNKRFTQRVPDGGGGWRYSLKGVDRVLYRLPELVSSGADGIWVVEGEKDVHALLDAGVEATCNPQGAGKWKDVRQWNDVFTGANVTIVRDKDEPGHKHAEQVRAELEPIAASVRIVEAAEGKDAADHLTAGHTLDQFVQVWPEPLPEIEAQFEASLLDSAGLDALQPPEPLIEKVLFLDSLAWLIGEPANGKSFVALDWAGHVGLGERWCGNRVRQGTVIYVSPESPGGLRLRKQAWEAAMGQDMDGVWFLPREVLAKNAGHWQAFIRVAKRRGAVLIIFDTQARMTVGMEENSALDMGEWVHKLEELRSATNACVLVVHHKTRGAKNMRGSTALEGAASTIINCAKAEMELTLSCDPADGGKTKDIEPFPKITLRMVPTERSLILAELGASPPAQQAAFGRAANEKLAEWWELHGREWLSLAQIERLEYFSERNWYRARKKLVSLGLLEEEQRGNYKVYRLTGNPIRT